MESKESASRPDHAQLLAWRLLQACARRDEAQALELIGSGAPVNVVFCRQDFDALPKPSPAFPYGSLEGRSALMAAAARGMVRVMDALMDAGADPELADPKHHWRAVHWAASRNQVEALEALRARGADVHAVSGDFGDALAWAVYAQEPAFEAAKALLDWGARMDWVSDEEEALAKSDHESSDPEGKFVWAMGPALKELLASARLRRELEGEVKTPPAAPAKGL